VCQAIDHAWIVTTDALSYKAPLIDWKQQRLAAELKATTEKMDLLIAAFHETSVRVQESPWPEIDAKKAIHNFFLAAADSKLRGLGRHEAVPQLTKRCNGTAGIPSRPVKWAAIDSRPLVAQHRPAPTCCAGRPSETLAYRFRIFKMSDDRSAAENEKAGTFEVPASPISFTICE
jgi:hypothetical protein